MSRVVAIAITAALQPRQLRAFDLKILRTGDQEFLIGDAPVLLMREGHGGLGFFDGVGVGNADEIVMPLTPRHVAFSARAASPGTRHPVKPTGTTPCR